MIAILILISLTESAAMTLGVKGIFLGTHSSVGAIGVLWQRANLWALQTHSTAVESLALVALCFAGGLFTGACLRHCVKYNVRTWRARRLMSVGCIADARITSISMHKATTKTEGTGEYANNDHLCSYEFEVVDVNDIAQKVTAVDQIIPQSIWSKISYADVETVRYFRSNPQHCCLEAVAQHDSDLSTSPLNMSCVSAMVLSGVVVGVGIFAVHRRLPISASVGAVAWAIPVFIALIQAIKVSFAAA